MTRLVSFVTLFSCVLLFVFKTYAAKSADSIRRQAPSSDLNESPRHR
jgi:hypothetical protein